jgi:zinc/manganese transport system substrate-binding protein
MRSLPESIGSNRTRRHLVLSAAAALAVALVDPRRAAAADAPLRVVATFSILADFAREVGGPLVQVTSLVPAGADAHVYAPSPADARRLAQAELVVMNGLHYEGWIARLLAATGYRGPVVVATDGIAPRRVGTGADPHAWQNLAHAVHYVARIRDALVALRPAAAGEFQSRAEAYSARLTALDRDTRARIAAIAPERRRLITPHDAFGYFADAYGVRFLSPRGWSTEAEPSADTVARIVRQVRQDRVSALLVENLGDPRLMERIAREAGVSVGGRLYADALSPPGTEADTFLRLFEHNVRTIVGAMTAPTTASAPRP